jgi:hypothetical protein
MSVQRWSAATLVLVLALINGADATSGAPAAGTATGVRRTPFGDLPRECVKRVPSGATVVSNDETGEMEVTHADGKFERVRMPAHCSDAVDTLKAALVRTQSQPQPQGDVAGPSAGADTDAIYLSGWIDYVKWMPDYHLVPISFFNGTMSVPDTPDLSQSESSTVLYWFTGLQNIADRQQLRILQPVLTFAGPTATQAQDEPAGWSLTSWDCCPGSAAWYSDPITGFDEGDVLYGEMSRNAAGETYTVTSTIPGVNSTVLTVETSNVVFDEAVATLEVYDIADCAAFPHDEVAFSDMTILDDSGTSFPGGPKWDVTTGSDCMGETTVIDPLAKITISCDPTA